MTAIYVVKTLKILCPECGAEVSPPVTGSTEWTPEVARQVYNAQFGPDYSEVAEAPMCSGCGAFLRLRRPTENNFRTERPADLPCPEVAS